MNTSLEKTTRTRKAQTGKAADGPATTATSSPYNTRSANTQKDTGERYHPGQSDVNDAASARAFLEKRQYRPTEMDDTPEETVETLVSTLLQVVHTSANTPKVVVEGVRAVSFLLLELKSMMLENLVQETIRNSIREEFKTHAGRFEAITNQRPPDQPHEQSSGETSPPQTYAAVARRHLPTSHAIALDKENQKARRIIIKRTADSPTNENELDEEILLTKANIAWENLDKDIEDTRKPKGIKVRCVTILPSKDIALELDSAVGAKYLSDPTNASRFAQGMGAYYRIKQRTHAVIAEYVPISLDPDNHRDIEHLERASGLQEKAIAHFQWIKPIENRKQNQRTAFAYINFHSPDDANHAIRNGLVYKG